MSSFLQKIALLTEERVATAKRDITLEQLKEAPLFARTPSPVTPAFKNGNAPHIIAEIKFASPSEGEIRGTHNPVEIAKGYIDAGATMLSILTEPLYFKGEMEYLRLVREAFPAARLLRKDFMVDSYQLYEARAIGADAILLIAAMTPPEVTRDLFHEAKALGLSPLVEVHDMAELEQAIDMGADFIGVNNRNLKTLKTDIGISHELSARKPPNAVFISESGLKTADDLRQLQEIGYDGYLMGTHFMRKDNPGHALGALIRDFSCA